jgi:peptidoglycan/LPS O-acetylase OafA/YrhL
MRRNLKPLTSLRFIAAAMIVVHHSHAYFGYGDWLGMRFSLGAGVDFFYVLSGFILYYSYRQFETARDVYNFYVARLARIWPLHFATFLLVFAFLPAPWGPPGSIAQEATTNLLLLQAWSPHINYFFSFNDVSWSLSVEAFFYLMFPVMIYRWSDTWKWKLLFCAAVVAATLQYLSIYPDKLVWNGNPVDPTAFIFPPIRLLEFTIGIASCSFWLWSRKALARIPVWAATALELTAFLGAGAALRWEQSILYSIALHNHAGHAAIEWLIQCGYAPAMAALIIVLASGQGIISRLLSMKLPVLLGEISFSVYMCHQIFLRVFAENDSLAAFGGKLDQYAAFWTSVLVMSYLLWEFIEKPCRHRAVRFFSLKPQAMVSAAQVSGAAD